MNHSLKMLLGCIVPLLLIFVLPAVGASSDTTYLVFLLIMFGCHLFMMGGHGHGQAGHHEGRGQDDDGR